MSDRPRVLVLTPDYPPAHGGIQILVDRVVAGWTRLDPRVVTFTSPGFELFDAERPFQVKRVRRRPLLGSRSALVLLNARGVTGAMRFRPAAVLSAHIATSPAAATLARFAGVPYVQYLHAQEVTARPALARFAIRHAAAVVAVSRFTVGLARAHGAPDESIHLIPPGVDLPSENDRRATDPPTVVTVGRLEDRYKGHDVVLRAFPLVRARVPGARLAIVGDGELRGVYEGLADALNCRDAIDFIGAVDDGLRDSILGGARVFVMPSRLSPTGRGEGFGIVYLEASAQGVPTVAGNVAGALDAVVDGKTGLLVDPSDHLAVAGAISRLLEDPDEARRMGEEGVVHAREFNWARAAHSVEELLLELISRRQ